MLVEQFLRLLLSAAERSKWGLLCVIVGSVLLCGILILGLVSTAGNVILVATGTKPVLEFLGSGLGILITAVVAIFLVRGVPCKRPPYFAHRQTAPCHHPIFAVLTRMGDVGIV